MPNSFESFAANPVRYFTSILSFLGGPRQDSIKIHEVVPTTEKNFRKGATDEWQSVFSDLYIKSSTDIITSALKTMFS